MDFNERYFGVPLAVILLLIGIGVATATSLAIVYKTTIQGSITIEETTSDNSHEVTVYKSRDRATEISSIDLGTAKPGQTIYPSEYVIKNTGDSYIPEVSYTDRFVVTSEGLEIGYMRTTSLEVGETHLLSNRVIVDTDAQPGNYSIKIPIVARASE